MKRQRRLRSVPYAMAWLGATAIAVLLVRSVVARDDLQSKQDRELVSAVVIADGLRADKSLSRGASANARNGSEANTNGAGTSPRDYLARLLHLSSGKQAGTPVLELAVIYKPELVGDLLDRGADPNGRDANGQTAMMWCTNRPDLVNNLLAGGADPDIADVDGHTALMTASADGEEDSVYSLLAGHASPQMRDKSGLTAVDYAKRHILQLQRHPERRQSAQRILYWLQHGVR